MSNETAKETVFASGKLIFPKPREDKLDTLEFLEAAKGVVSLVGNLKQNFYSNIIIC